jgi:hypothetical protein
LFLILSHAALYRYYEKWDGLLVLAEGVLYFWLSHLAAQRGWSTADAVQYRMSAFIYAAAATAMFFSGVTLGIIWAIEAVAAARLGALRQSRMDWIAACGLFFLAFLMWIDKTRSINVAQIWPLLNQQTLHTWVLAASLAIGGWWARDLSGKTGTVLSRVWHGVGAFTLFIWSWLQIHIWVAKRMVSTTGVVHDVWVFSQPLWTVIAWLLYALAMVWISLRFRLAVPLWAGAGAYVLAVLMAMLTGGSYSPLGAFVPVLNIRFAAFVSLAVGGWILGRQLRTASGISTFSHWVRLAAHVTIFLLIWELLTAETMDGFDRQIALTDSSNTNALHLFENLKQLSLSGVWLLYSIALMVFGIIRRLQSVRILSIVLFGITILKIFILDLSFLETLYRIFSFIGLGLILLAVSFVYQRYKDVLQLGGEKKENIDG